MQVPFPPVITGPAQSCVWLLTSMLCFMLYISWQCRLFTTVNCTCLNLSCRGPFISHELKSFLKESSYFDKYSHLFNKRGAWNKRGGGAKVAKSLNVELGINEEGGIFGKN